MSALLMGRAFYADLPAHLKFCLVALCDHADDDGGNVYPGQARLAAKLSVAVRTVRDQVHELERRGYLVPEGRQGQRGTVRYRIAVDRLPLDRQPTAERQNLPTGSPAHEISSRPAAHRRLDRQPTADNPSGNHQKKLHPPVLRSEFELFWSSYPPRDGRRDKKAEAWAEWQKLKPSPDLQAQMRSALGRYRTEKPVDACRWLKYRRWEDDVGLTPTRPRVLAAGGVPMLTYEESLARRRAEGRV